MEYTQLILDNLKGVPRIGMKTVVKYFPFVDKPQRISCSEIFTHCEMEKNKKSVHVKLLECKELVKSNYTIMQLYEPSISFQGRQQIDYTLSNYKPLFSKIRYMACFQETYAVVINIRRIIWN